MATPERAPDALTLARRVGRSWQPLALAGLGLVAVAAVHVRDPHVDGSWGRCPLQVLTGWDCPGCGGLRATHGLTHLDPWSAASSNLLLVLAIPIVVGMWALWVSRTWRGERRPTAGLSDAVVVVLIVAVLGFAVLRNLPFASWLAS